MSLTALKGRKTKKKVMRASARTGLAGIQSIKVSTL